MKKENLKNKSQASKGQAPRGQVMLLSALLIGGSILAATSVAGYLMVLQVRQSTNIASSAKAITAASTGIDWALYQRKIGNNGYSSQTLGQEYFSNGSEVRITKNGNIITSVGRSINSYRAFSLDVSGDAALPPGD